MTDNEDGEYRSYMGLRFKVRGSAAASAAAEPKFKVGDRVRVVKDGRQYKGSYHGADVGSVGVITEVIEGGYVRDDGWYFNHEDVELIPTFTPGQRVRLTRNAAGHSVGDEGRVVDGGERVLVKMDDRGVLRVFKPEALEAADCAVRKEQRKIKVGDWVRAMEDAEPGCQFTNGGFYQVRGVVGESIQIVADDKGLAANGWGREKFELVTPKFKAGDLVDNGYRQFTIKCLKTHYREDERYIGKLAYDYAEQWDYESDLTLVTAADCPQDNVQRASTTQPAIVALVKNGQPRPADRPYVHANADGALQEASRLARNNPGQEFAVYQRVAGRVCETTYNMKEVA